jgi:hypothetical protein
MNAMRHFSCIIKHAIAIANTILSDARETVKMEYYKLNHDIESRNMTQTAVRYDRTWHRAR